MATKSWEVSDEFWGRVSALIPKAKLYPAYPSAMRRKNSYSKRLQGERLDRRGRTFVVQPVSQTSRQVRKEQLVF